MTEEMSEAFLSYTYCNPGNFTSLPPPQRRGSYYAFHNALYATSLWLVGRSETEPAMMPMRLERHGSFRCGFFSQLC